MDFRERLLDFFTPEAGQRRTQALYGLLGDVGEAISPMLSPRGRQQAQNIVNLIDMVNPVSGMARAGSEFQQGNYGSSAVEVAGFAIPAGILAKYGTKTAVDAARNLSEMLAMSGGNIRDLSESAFEAAIQRMNQPGPMPTLGSNFGNIGHNQGPSLEPDEIIPPARPKYIGEYSASLDAAEKLPQARGTFDQMRKMMLDRGAKEDELIWSGFDREFRDQGKVTKEGIIDYLGDTTGDNMVSRYTNQVEGVLDEASFKSPEELRDMYVDQNIEYETEYFMDDYRRDLLANQGMDYELFKADEIFEEDMKYLIKAYQNNELSFNPNKIPEDKYVYFKRGNMVTDDDIRLVDEDEALDIIMNEETASGMAFEYLSDKAYDMDVVELRDLLGLGGTADAGESGVKFAEFFTPGSKNYAENRYVYEAPTIGVRGRGMEFNQAHHDESDIFVHTRTGEFPLAAGGGNVHHVGEIQSDWAQQLRKARKNSEYRIMTQGPNQSANEEPYRSLSFDEVADMTQSKQGAEAMGFMEGEAMRMVRDFDDEVMNSTKIVAPEDYLVGQIQAWRAKKYPDDARATGYPSIAHTAEYFMDTNNSHPVLTEWRKKYAYKYKQAKKVYEKGRPLFSLDAKEGGPLIESTNKWVDFALRRELVDAVKTGNEYMTINNSEMVRDMTMGQEKGQSEFYDKIVPQRLQKLLRTFDKKAKLEPIEIQTGNGVKKVLGVRLTDDLVRKIADKGMPIFSVPAGAGLLGAMNREEQKRENPSGLLGVY